MNLRYQEVTVHNYHKQYHVSIADHIRQIANVLACYGIIHFSHARLYKNKSCNILTTHPEFSEHFVRENFVNLAFGADISLYRECVVLNSEVDMPEITQALLEYNIANVLIFVKPSKSHLDFWYFGSSPNDTKVREFYFSNLNILENFIEYFKEKSSRLLEKLYHNRILYPGVWNDKSKLITQEIKKLDLLQSLANVQLENKNLYSLAMTRKFTVEELRCASYLTLGFVPKEIARETNKSVRTVEKHLLSLRKKMNSRSLIHLVSQLASNRNHTIKKLV